MNLDTSRRTKVSIALDTLRQRICLAPQDEDVVLHENGLAEEFQISRTPVRQVLQRLAYERLVETVSGVGTLARALQEENRLRDSVTHHALLNAIASHDLEPLSLTEHSQFFSLKAVLDAADEINLSLHYEIRRNLAAIVSNMIDDPILRDAFLAAHWRSIRWHMRGAALDGAVQSQRLRRMIKKLAKPKSRNPKMVLEVLASDAL